MKVLVLLLIFTIMSITLAFLVLMFSYHYSILFILIWYLLGEVIEVLENRKIKKH